MEEVKTRTLTFGNAAICNIITLNHTYHTSKLDFLTAVSQQNIFQYVFWLIKWWLHLIFPYHIQSQGFDRQKTHCIPKTFPPFMHIFLSVSLSHLQKLLHVPDVLVFHRAVLHVIVDPASVSRVSGRLCGLLVDDDLRMVKTPFKERFMKSTSHYVVAHN